MTGRPKISIIAFIILLFIQLACSQEGSASRTVPYKERWGIYQLVLRDENTTLIYSSATTITNIRQNPNDDRFVFAKIVGEESQENYEIFTIDGDGGNEKRLTQNGWLDTYPVWSPGGEAIAYLAWPDQTLDIYWMDKEGGGSRLLYDSGYHDADIDWMDDQIAFTRNSQIWLMNSDGTHATAITDPPRAGEMGNANLPFGDYDPRLSPNMERIAFERLEDDRSPHGNYNFYTVNLDGSDLQKLTNTGYSQGMPSWSPSSKKMLYIVAAMGDAGKYDMYIMNSDGTGTRELAPEYFPANVLVHEAIFSPDESKIFFIAEWWG